MNKSEAKFYNTAIKMNNALFKLLEKKSFQDISVSEICDVAGVNRSSFYSHYNNTYDLLKETHLNFMKEFSTSFEESISKIDISQIIIEDFISDKFIIPFLKFIKKNNCSPVIKDIYGKEHNVIDEDIQIIFTKSQFKMWKYYDSWEQYKEYYKRYNCTAGYTNLEEDKIKNATINYQMLQTLTDITDDEIDSIKEKSQKKLDNVCTLEGMKDAFGVTSYNDNMTYLQQAINLYPTLLNDEYIKATLREIKDSMVKRYKAGSLAIRGKYTFLLPDFYADRKSVV